MRVGLSGSFIYFVLPYLTDIDIELWLFHLIQSNLSVQTPLYYRQFVWSQKCQKSYIPYLYNTDTSVKQTLGSVPLVSVLKRFDCSQFT